MEGLGKMNRKFHKMEMTYSVNSFSTWSEMGQKIEKEFLKSSVMYLFVFSVGPALYLISIILYLSVYCLIPPHTGTVLCPQVNQIKLKIFHNYIS